MENNFGRESDLSHVEGERETPPTPEVPRDSLESFNNEVKKALDESHRVGQGVQNLLDVLASLPQRVGRELSPDEMTRLSELKTSIEQVLGDEQKALEELRRSIVVIRSSETPGVDSNIQERQEKQERLVLALEEAMQAETRYTELLQDGAADQMSSAELLEQISFLDSLVAKLDSLKDHSDIAELIGFFSETILLLEQKEETRRFDEEDRSRVKTLGQLFVGRLEGVGNTLKERANDVDKTFSEKVEQQMDRLEERVRIALIAEGVSEEEIEERQIFNEDVRELTKNVIKKVIKVATVSGITLASPALVGMVSAAAIPFMLAKIGYASLIERDKIKERGEVVGTAREATIVGVEAVKEVLGDAVGEAIAGSAVDVVKAINKDGIAGARTTKDKLVGQIKNVATGGVNLGKGVRAVVKSSVGWRRPPPQPPNANS